MNKQRCLLSFSVFSFEGGFSYSKNYFIKCLPETDFFIFKIFQEKMEISLRSLIIRGKMSSNLQCKNQIFPGTLIILFLKL